jgi:extradiol dioxygenase family protein
MSLPPFHLAFPVHDLTAARAFWGGTMGCAEGRSSEQWIDFDFYGHQIVAHCTGERAGDAGSNPAWHKLAERLKLAGVAFEIEPHIRFKGETGEQATMFFRDPSGNAIEIKAFSDLAQLFAR